MSRIQHEKQNLSISELQKIVDHRMKHWHVQFDLDWTTALLLMSKKHYVLKISVKNFRNQDPSSWCILKIFNDRIADWETRWNREYENYHKLSNLNTESENLGKLRIPQMYPSPTGILLLDYIPGKSLDEILDIHQFTPLIATKFAQWLSNLHQNGYIFGDQRLTNFVYADRGEIYAVDLEDLDRGDPIEDVAGFLEAFLDYKSLIFHDQFPEYPVQGMLAFLDSYLLFSEKLRTQFHQNRELFVFFQNFLGKYLRKVADRRNYSFPETQEKLILAQLEKRFETYPFHAISPLKDV